MKHTISIIIISCFISFTSCNNKQSELKNKHQITKLQKKSTKKFKTKIHSPLLLDTLTANFKNEDLVDVTLFSKDFLLDIKYATMDNFVDTILYPCAKCLLRYEVLKDLLKIQKDLKSAGYKIKLYDCYRPISVQRLMWKKVPVVGLVANPATGSRHNRGSAVDIGITDFNDKDINMGTDYDDLTRKSRTFYTGFSDTITQNRLLLRKFMEKHNFKGINSEWWHFSHNCGTKYKVSNVQFNCK